ncbi:alpha/beta hydrolase [Coxiella endosymbiont of Ornithodoros amblus]|nr:alpha/beta hydrolase [Coxiella endosymbiont of Ornithodoros amblus]
MRGTIAALYTEKYPAQVHSLAFIGALFGLLDPFSLLCQIIKRINTNPCMPLISDEFHEEMKLLFYEAYPVKLERRSYLLKFYRSYKERLQRITKIVFADATILENSLKISVPTLIIWGKQDHLLSVKSASPLRANN